MLDEDLIRRISNPPRKSVNLMVRVDPSKLNFISMVVDGHGRIALPRTRNGKQGILDFLTSPDFVDDLYLILDDIKRNYDPTLQIVKDLGDNWLEAVI
jgi:FixJ family two-component response regulator